jgi:hypothetical protein
MWLKMQNPIKSDLFYLEKLPLERFNLNHLFTGEVPCQIREKVTEQFLRKSTLKFLPFDPMLIFFKF